MITAKLVLQFTAIINFALGLFIYGTQPRRAQNRMFFVFSTLISLWAACMAIILPSQTEFRAAFFIRLASYIATWLPLGFYGLCLAMAGEVHDVRSALKRSHRMLILSQVAGLLCFTPFYLSSVSIADPALMGWHPPAAKFGPAFLLYNLFIMIAFGWTVIRFIGILRRSQGVHRTELQFVMLGMCTTLVFSLTTNVLHPAITGSSRLQPFGPLGFLAMNAIMAYGIATRRVLEVAVILRRATAYTLLAVYLGLLYFLTIIGFNQVWNYVYPAPAPPALASAIGAIVVILSMAPAQGIMQRLANRLFINTRPLDVPNIVKRVSRTMQSITTLDALLNNFTQLVVSSMEAESLVILSAKGESFEQIYPRRTDAPPITISPTSALARSLRSSNSPLVVDTVRRRRTTPLVAQAAQDLTAMGMAAAASLQLKGEQRGIMLLGPRISGRYYGGPEEDAIQILANELAIAIENATLYTGARNSDIYNNILLNSLVSGVIAINSERRITVFNGEAQRILKLKATDLLGRDLSLVPAPLQRLIEEILASGSRIEEKELEIPLPNAGPGLHVRAGGAVFHAHTGQPLGALIVFHNITQIKAMENQIRRQDRLASMGTLSAGMAHEIKNPLVTIKTFTQLLPERYDDSEFRRNFTELVGREVMRIDGIVNQLLTFARPSKPSLASIHMHTVLADTLRLVTQQMEQAGIRISTDFRCPSDLVLGDSTLLNQAFINFFLNAREAMPEGGSLHVTTSVIQHGEAIRRHGQPTRPASDQYMVIRIADTGIGIASADMIRIFDPFFTTKSSGTGLGLAVSHGIIQEQGGMIDVESQVGKGTAFIIHFPIPVKDAQA